MPRGRHRHSPPLHRLLPPATIAGAAGVCAGGALLVSDPSLLRVLVAVAAAQAVAAALLMRDWDRKAGKQVADLTRARISDEWRAEERIAELEGDLEEARELRARLDAKLRAKRVELAGLRGEHAALLRRYATAETERASALEGRRLLALEAASPEKDAQEVPAGGSPTASLYVQANAALKNLARNAAAQEGKRVVEQARRRDLAERAAEGAEEPAGKHAAAAGREHLTRPAATPAAREHLDVPVAAAIVPYAVKTHRPASRAEGNFDFFGTKKAAKTNQSGPAELERAHNEDLADVVGPEALAVHKAEADADGFKSAPAGGTQRAVGQVVDLTEHDETEVLNVVRLRSAIS
ncbi:hypothetical protein [Streptomyces sp. GC420]|uniref:hypothetical protein n=1 Tax=Streptomyces sp. GC420 TaxID=2697568 RepID=UPI0014152137|nr:hypothetical protein [Streptomyces sp. GC420]NBM19059.1 hypothetical protein [Streptomyces sp. GC420]